MIVIRIKLQPSSTLKVSFSVFSSAFEGCSVFSFIHTNTCLCVCSTERDIKFVRPLYSVEVTETEIAKFETEISEEEVHGHWKLKGEALHQSAVRKYPYYYYYIIGRSLLRFIAAEKKIT